MDAFVCTAVCYGKPGERGGRGRGGGQEWGAEGGSLCLCRGPHSSYIPATLPANFNNIHSQIQSKHKMPAWCQFITFPNDMWQARSAGRAVAVAYHFCMTVDVRRAPGDAFLKNVLQHHSGTCLLPHTALRIYRQAAFRVNYGSDLLYFCSFFSKTGPWLCLVIWLDIYGLRGISLHLSPCYWTPLGALKHCVIWPISIFHQAEGNEAR